MIWDTDSYLILGEDEHPFSPTGADLIPEPWLQEKLMKKREARIVYQRGYRRRTRGAQS